MSDKYPELDGVIKYIHQHIYEPLSLTRLADYAAYSPYHFTRIFKERTGLTPQYYVSSIRLQQAKALLLNTNLKVRDIGLEVGQQSLGTFTTRFTERVGVTPSQFRASMQQAQEDLRFLKQLGHWPSLYLDDHSSITIEGKIQAETSFEGIILIGLFPKAIPEGMPLCGTLLPSLGDFCLTGVKPGVYYIMATSVSWGMDPVDFMLPNQTLRYKSTKPIIVHPNTTVPFQQITLRAPRLEDPPILISIPRLMNHFLNRNSFQSCTTALVEYKK